MPASLRRFSNAVVETLLLSPLHGLVSKTTMLITVTGRKTGIAYTVPVDYLQCRDSVEIFTRQEHTWWKNVCGGADVRLQLRGHEVKGYATVETPTPDIVSRELRELYPRMTEMQAAELAVKTVIVRITLKDQVEVAPAA